MENQENNKEEVKEEEEEEEEEKKDVTTEEELEKLRQSKFKQQLLPAWRPVPTVFSTAIIFSAIGIIFLIFGIVLTVYSNKIVEIKVRYDDKCNLNETCSVNIKVDKSMKPPIMMYFQIDNFYQNHRMYVKSHSDDQLKGKSFTYKQMDKAGECEPVVSNREMGKTKAVDGTELDPEDLAIPCGLIAKSFFTDTYLLYDNDYNRIKIDEKNIAWDADKKKKFKNTKGNWQSKQWIDMTNEHFIVWMRPAGLEGFRKLWGRIRQPLLGDYIMEVNNLYDVSPYKGKKYIVLSTANAFGGKNYFLAYSYIVVGVLAIALVLLYLIIGQFKQTKRKSD